MKISAINFMGRKRKSSKTEGFSYREHTDLFKKKSDNELLARIPELTKEAEKIARMHPGVNADDLVQEALLNAIEIMSKQDSLSKNDSKLMHEKALTEEAEIQRFVPLEELDK